MKQNLSAEQVIHEYECTCIAICERWVQFGLPCDQHMRLCRLAKFIAKRMGEDYNALIDWYLDEARSNVAAMAGAR